MTGTSKDAGGRPVTYADAGVDIDAGNALVDAIKPLAKSTLRLGADADLGGFGGLFDLKRAGFEDPILVSTNDGVGTKLKIAISFIRMFREGPEVSLNGSPTVSPTTAAL